MISSSSSLRVNWIIPQTVTSGSPTSLPLHSRVVLLVVVDVLVVMAGVGHAVPVVEGHGHGHLHHPNKVGKVMPSIDVILFLKICHLPDAKCAKI